MPWCPKCKNEYREGFSECSECHVALVAQLSDIQVKPIIPILFGKEDALTDIRACLLSNAVTDPKVMYEASVSAYKLMILEEEKVKAQRIINAYMQELAKKNGAEEEIQKKSLNQKLQSQYIDPSEKAKENHSTGISLIAFGMIGIILLVLLWLGIIPSNFNQIIRILGTLIMGGFFLVLVFSGVLAMKSSKSLLSKDEKDRKLEDEIIAWCKEHLSEKDRLKLYAADNHSATLPGASSSEEEIENSLFFARNEYMMNRIQTAFPTCEKELAEYICDRIFDSIFEGNNH